MTTSTVGTGLAPVRATLANGAVILAKEATTTPAVTINLTIRAGSVCDPPSGAGAMHLLSRLIDRGTATRSADDIAEELDSRGIALTTTVTRHVFSVSCTCLADDFEPVLALAAETIVAPTIPDSELATRKGEVITAIRQDEDNPAARCVETLMTALYGGDHPYGRPAKGTVDSVERLTRDDLLAVHAARFAPAELIAIVVGDVPPVRVVDAAARVIGDWKVPRPEPVALRSVAPAAARTRIVIPMMNKAQADVAYGFVSITRADPAFEAFRLMNNAFGQYAIGGRLGDSIRERQGMAYYVFSSLDASVIEGPLVIRAGVSRANVDRTIASIDGEIARLLQDGLTEREVTESRQYLIGSLPRTLETNAGIAQFLQMVEFFGLGLDYDVRMPELLRGVTRDQVNAAARRVFDVDRATVVIAGPYAADGGIE